MLTKGYIFSVLYVLLCVGLALVLYKLGLPKKYTRKTVHILVGFDKTVEYGGYFIFRDSNACIGNIDFDLVSFGIAAKANIPLFGEF